MQRERDSTNQPSGTTGPEPESETTLLWRREQLGSYTDVSGTAARPARLRRVQQLGPLGTVVGSYWLAELDSFAEGWRGARVFVMPPVPESKLMGSGQLDLVLIPLQGVVLDVFSDEQVRGVLDAARGVVNITFRTQVRGLAEMAPTFSVADLTDGFARQGDLVLQLGAGIWQLIWLGTSPPSSVPEGAAGEPEPSGSTRSELPGMGLLEVLNQRIERSEVALRELERIIENPGPVRDAAVNEIFDRAEAREAQVMMRRGEPAPADPADQLWTQEPAEGQMATRVEDMDEVDRNRRDGEDRVENYDNDEAENPWRDKYKIRYMNNVLLNAQRGSEPSQAKVCITTNGSVRKDGRAVMGRGIALAAKNMFKGLDLRLGYLIRLYGNRFQYMEKNLYSFPVKHRWHEVADMDLIKESCRALAEAANELPKCTFYLPLPGCGNGQLDFEKVVPEIFDLLPPNATLVTNDRKVRDRLYVLQGGEASVEDDVEEEDSAYF